MRNQGTHRTDDVGFDLETLFPEVPDSLTRLKRNFALHSRHQLDDLNQQCANEFLIVNIDFRAVGLADRCGLGDELESVFRGLNEACSSAFPGHITKLFRRCGDEFVLIVGNQGERSASLLEGFRSVLGNLTETCIPDGPELAKAEWLRRFRERLLEIVQYHEEGSSFLSYAESQFFNGTPWLGETWKADELTRWKEDVLKGAAPGADRRIYVWIQGILSEYLEDPDCRTVAFRDWCRQAEGQGENDEYSESRADKIIVALLGAYAESDLQLMHIHKRMSSLRHTGKVEVMQPSCAVVSFSGELTPFTMKQILIQTDRDLMQQKRNIGKFEQDLDEWEAVRIRPFDPETPVDEDSLEELQSFDRLDKRFEEQVSFLREIKDCEVQRKEHERMLLENARLDSIDPSTGLLRLSAVAPREAPCGTWHVIEGDITFFGGFNVQGYAYADHILGQFAGIMKSLSAEDGAVLIRTQGGGVLLFCRECPGATDIAEARRRSNRVLRKIGEEALKKTEADFYTRLVLNYAEGISNARPPLVGRQRGGALISEPVVIEIGRGVTWGAASRMVYSKLLDRYRKEPEAGRRKS